MLCLSSAVERSRCKQPSPLIQLQPLQLKTLQAVMWRLNIVFDAVVADRLSAS